MRLFLDLVSLPLNKMSAPPQNATSNCRPRRRLQPWQLTLLCLLAALTGLSGCARDNLYTAVLVEVPRPPGLDDGTLIRGFEQALPDYAGINGLHRKYFIMSDSAFGGVYLWADRRRAEAFFNSQWHARVRDTYGKGTDLTYFSVPATTAGQWTRAADADAAVAVVRVPAPGYAWRGLIASTMQSRVEEYAQLPDLLFKYFTITDDKQVGGVYLWRNADSRAAFYDPAWHAGIEERYGTAASLDLFAAPLVLLNSSPAGE